MRKSVVCYYCCKINAQDNNNLLTYLPTPSKQCKKKSTYLG